MHASTAISIILLHKKKYTLTLYWFCSQKQLRQQFRLSMMASINVANSMQTASNYKDQSNNHLLPRENAFDHFFLNFSENKRKNSLIIFSNLSCTFSHLLKTLPHLQLVIQNKVQSIIAGFCSFLFR